MANLQQRTDKTVTTLHVSRFGVFIVYFEHISLLFLVFLSSKWKWRFHLSFVNFVAEIMKNIVKNIRKVMIITKLFFSSQIYFSYKSCCQLKPATTLSFSLLSIKPVISVTFFWQPECSENCWKILRTKCKCLAT